MVRNRLLIVAGVMVASLGWVAAQAPVVPRVSPQKLRMQPEDALTFEGTTLNVFGDPDKPGLYAIRRRFKPGEMSRPHTHDQDRLVTVIKGTWWTGEGNRFTPDRTTPVKTGGFMLHPKGLAHYDGAKDEEVIVQIIGMGPVKTTQVEVDSARRGE
jgi:quercetin dioxygenase-like cupin family protein